VSAVLSLLTDFGPGSLYVGQVHAVLRQHVPDAVIIDLAHDCPPGGIEAAAYLLEASRATWPEGCVHIVVVDPGVGTSRRVIAARIQGQTFIGPDNGVLTAVVSGGEVRAVTNPALVPAGISATFHGRDVMAPVAARLAQAFPFHDVGPAVVPHPAPAGPELEAGSVTGCVLIEDRFGNLITNISRPLVEMMGVGLDVRVRINGAFIDGLSTTYGDVPTGRILAYIGSGGHLEIAINGDSAAKLLHLGVKAPICVERRGSS